MNKEVITDKQQMKNEAIKVFVKRGRSIESIHEVNAVLSDQKGKIIMSAGDPNFTTFIRSSLKPFQAIPFINRGASQQLRNEEKGIAIACGSHCGSIVHAREAFKILWESEVDVSDLQCPIGKDEKSKLTHNCSGKHASFLATCRRMNWSTKNYLDQDHPLQLDIIRNISNILNCPCDELILEKDNCGAPTLNLQLGQMAHLYAHLSMSQNQHSRKIISAMIAYPDLVAGKGFFDTELITKGEGQLISKGGSEGIQCIGKINEGFALAIKVLDGSKRAKHAVAIHLLKQLDWLASKAIKELFVETLIFSPGVELEVSGNLSFYQS